MLIKRGRCDGASSLAIASVESQQKAGKVME